MIERQVFVTWYTPEEKMPPEGEFVVVSVSGKISKNVGYDHTFAIAEWYNDGEGWTFDNEMLARAESVTVHAWCDLMPYGSKE